MKYVADFETNNHADDCRVWAYAILSMDGQEYYTGNSISGFIDTISRLGSATYYFHNLAFDGEFICNWLLRNGWQWVEKNPKGKQFTTIINDMSVFYSVVIPWRNSKGKQVLSTILDSFKLIPKSVAEIAEKFKLDTQKLDLDYDTIRPIGHVLTEHEKEYLYHDVEIMRQALNIFFSQGLEKMTIGSNALTHCKQLIGKKQFERLFPPPKYDKDIRQAYKGGFTYLKPGYSDRDVSNGLVLDVNSLYPYCQRDKLLPFGEPKYFKGKYRYDPDYPLYIQMFTCSFDIKNNHIPTLQLKGNLSFRPTEYVTRSKGEQTLCLSNVDLQLMLKHYNVHNIQYHSGWKFMARHDMFTQYIDYWMNIKITSEKTGNSAMREIAKLYLNNLYGKFSKNPDIGSRHPEIDDNGIIHYVMNPIEHTTPLYIPVGIYITAYGREKTITSAQANYDRFIYADTDSLHLEGSDSPADLDIDKYRLGAWKQESTFTRARFIRAKCYYEENQNTGKIICKCSGLPDAERAKLNWDNFHPGYETRKKLKKTHVNGGIVLQESLFTIKA